MRIKTLMALYFWILEFDNVTCIRSAAINDFGKLFSAGPYKVTVEIKIFRFAPEINFSIIFH